jgi:hypothetical protein
VYFGKSRKLSRFKKNEIFAHFFRTENLTVLSLHGINNFLNLKLTFKMKFKKLQIVCLFIFALFTGVAQAQDPEFEANYLNMYGTGKYLLTEYHPLTFSNTPVKTTITELYDTTTSGWDEFVRLSFRHTPNCARVSGRDIKAFGGFFNFRDTNIYVGNLLTAVVSTDLNTGLQYGRLDFKYRTGSVQPDTLFSSEDTTRTVFTYNANGVASALVQKRVGGIYQNKERFTYNHNAAKEQVFYRKEVYDSLTVAWFSDQAYVTTYNAAGKISSILDISYNSAGTPDTTFIGLTYDAQNRVTSLVGSERINGVVTPVGRFRTLNFETNGNVKEAVSEEYMSGGLYVGSEKVFYKSGNDARLTEIIVQVKNSAGVFINESRYRIEYCGTGVNVTDLVDNSEVKLYPNPVAETLNVELETASFNNAMTVEILDITGRSLKIQSFSSENAQINVSELPQGVFFVRVQSGSNSAIKRFVRAN